MILVGAAPTAMMVTMLRRGAALRPRLTLALAGLAVGGLANVAMQMFHQSEISLMVLVWHLGAVAMLTAPGRIPGADAAKLEPHPGRISRRDARFSSSAFNAAAGQAPFTNI